MGAAQQNPSALEAQLDLMRNLDTTEAAQRVRRGVHKQLAGKRRIVALALLGCLVSALGTIHFVRLGDPFGYFALTLTTAVLGWCAWRYARGAQRMIRSTSGSQMLADWRRELSQQRRQTAFAQLVAVQFSLLTGWVVWRHGFGDFRTLIYVLTAVGIWTFSLYQWLVVRPALQRELDAVKDPAE